MRLKLRQQYENIEKNWSWSVGFVACGDVCSNRRDFNRNECQHGVCDDCSYHNHDCWFLRDFEIGKADGEVSAFEWQGIKSPALFL